MRGRRLAVVLAIAASAAAAGYALTHMRVFQGIFGAAELKTVDYRIRNNWDGQTDSAGVAMIMFDTLSVEAWPYLVPFPRAVLADLIDIAAANGARAIGLDVFLGKRYPELSERDNGDERLRDAIARAGTVVLVAPTQGPPDARELVAPDPYFADVAAAVATADLPTAMDVLRDVTLVTRTRSGLVPGFSLALWAIGTGRDLDALLADADRTGRLDIPGLPASHAAVRASGATVMPVRLVGPPSIPGELFQTFPAYSGFGVQAAGMFGRENEALSSWFRGRVVLLGSSFHDSERFRTAYYDEVKKDTAKAGEIYGWMFGVEVHANVVQNLLTASFMKPLSAGLTILLLFAVSLAAAAGTFWRGAKWGAVGGIVAFAVVWFAALLAYDRGHVVLPVIGPAMAIALSFMSSAAYVSIVEGREKRMIRGAFSKYVPPGVVDDLVADPTKLKLGGEKRTISILFSDVAGFTSMSEVLPAETLVSVLNEYLDEMSDIVFDEGGTLDKYIGDAVMALYGAPTALPNHELHACRTALRMQRRLLELNEGWQAAGNNWPVLKIRIGVNTGTPVVGNIGGERRFDYTALGDAVNLAARLEPACKNYGVRIMIAENTRAGAGDAIVVRELDMLAVYGKAEPVPVYELVALAGEPIGDKQEVIELYGKGLQAYRARDFELALQYFKAALEIDPQDGPSRLYRERSEDYMVNPPPADWDFVERRMVK